MSKAFTKETDTDAAEEPVPLRTALPAGVPNYMTPAGASRLREELIHLRQELRPVLLGMSLQDRTASARLRRVDGRIAELKASLARAEIVPLPEKPVQEVQFGTRVTVRDLEGHEQRWSIVGIDEADPDDGSISWRAPLARALMRAHPGEKVSLQTPEGETEMTVVAIEPLEEKAA